MGNDKLYTLKEDSFRFYREEELFNLIKKYLDDHPRKVTITELSEYFHYNRDYLSRVFLNNIHLTIREYNTTVYLKEAYRLLKETSLSVSEITRRTGFASRSQFYQAIRDHYGCTPAEVRK